jgi:hypothetical protein
MVHNLCADGSALTRTVRDPYTDGPTNPFRLEPDDQTNRNKDAQEHETNTKNPRPKSSARTVCGEDHVWFEDRWMVASWCDE